MCVQMYIKILFLLPGASKYIGASDIQNEGNWFYVDGTNVNLTIFDGHNMNDQDASYPPGDARRTNADCGVIFDANKQLGDEYCGNRYSFICELVF